MRVLLLESEELGSSLLKQKMFPINIDVKNKSYYVENMVLGPWLRWSLDEKSKLELALKLGFENYFNACEEYIKTISKFTNLLEEACEGGNIIIIDKLIKAGYQNWDLGLTGACRGGHMNIVNMIIEKGGRDWSSGLRGACRGGHIEIAKLMLKKGAIHVLWALDSACKGKQLEMVKFLVDCYAEKSYVYSRCLIHACECGVISIVKWIVEKNKSIDRSCGLIQAYRFKNNDILIYLLRLEINPITAIENNNFAEEEEKIAIKLLWTQIKYQI